jgi:hypothetical protein
LQQKDDAGECKKTAVSVLNVGQTRAAKPAVQNDL